MITATTPSTTTIPTGTVSTTATGTTTVSSAASQASSQAAQPGGALGENEFMQLLVAQLQNQDPMNPMDGDQMASELAQFSSLEQLQSINTTLTGQSSSASTLLGAVQSTAAIATIGHTVLATGNQVQVGGSTPSGSVTADIAAAATTATLNIYNSAGVQVGTESLGALAAGQQTFNISDATSGLGAGTYTYSISATDSTGAAVGVTTYMSGVIDGVSSGQNGL
ncbi:MAG TPA: flagellar hook capping FlgD N-terminal domain-containing protein, partial [Gemmatimonadaceae bacterium]|nr:flagellar hook capping FlgD N-terminal domain-containing protein [Gemmatimonadaceae bacterium]